MTLTYGEASGAKPHAVTQCVSGAGNQRLTYDANGNRAAKGASTYAYDLQNRLVQVVAPGLTQPPAPPDPNTPFLEQAGLLSIEAQHPHGSVTRSSKSWLSLSSQPDSLRRHLPPGQPRHRKELRQVQGLHHQEPGAPLPDLRPDPRHLLRLAPRRRPHRQ